jgi:hypothetical protein
VVTLAIAGAAFALGRFTQPAAVTAAVSAPSLTIASSRDGDVVVVDGREVGVTPYRLLVDASVREVRLASPPEPIAAAPPPPEPVATGMPPVPVDMLAPVRPRSGGLRLSAPIDVQVLEGERVLGTSTEGPIIASAGVHQLDFVNSALGYRERRAVEFKAGQVLSLTVTPPDGMLNINAVPWGQVAIDGRDVGETPLANVAIPTGQHEIVFRHPQFGERKETAVVKSGTVTRLSVTMSRPTP